MTLTINKKRKSDPFPNLKRHCPSDGSTIEKQMTSRRKKGEISPRMRKTIASRKIWRDSSPNLK